MMADKSWSPEILLWMAPALQALFETLAWVGCSRLSGLLMQSFRTAGPDGVRKTRFLSASQAVAPETFHGLPLLPA